MTNFTPKQLDSEELKQKEEQFQLEVFGNPEEMEKVFHNLHDFFKNKSPEVDYKYYNSHFRWYTEVSWKELRRRNKDFIANIAVPRQIFLATLLGYDVTDKLLSYLKTKCVDENEMQSLYKDIQKSFENSSEIIYSSEESTFTVSDLVDKFKSTRKKDDYSLEQAKLYTQIKDEVSDTDWFEYKFVEFEEVLEKLEELTAFVEQADVDSIFYVVDAYFFPERYERYTQEGEVADEMIEEEESATLDQAETPAELEQPSSSEESEGTTREEMTTEATEENNTEEQKVKDILEEEPESEPEPEETQEEVKQTETKEEGGSKQEIEEEISEQPEEATKKKKDKKEEVEKQKEEPPKKQAEQTKKTEKQQKTEEPSSVEDILEEEIEQETPQTEQKKEEFIKEEQTTEQEKTQARRKEKDDTKEDTEEQEKVSLKSAKKEQKTEKKEGATKTSEVIESKQEPEQQQRATKKGQKEKLSTQAKQAKEQIEEHKGMSEEEIKDEVESQFGPIENLDPTNIDSFRRVLKNIARQEDREGEVSDWFYFDQESGKFKWDI